jgi:hypothetical protein
MDNALKKSGASTSMLCKKMGVSRTTAHRMVTGERFHKIRVFFSQIFEATGVTPNEILDIPPRPKGGE